MTLPSCLVLLMNITHYIKRGGDKLNKGYYECHQHTNHSLLDCTQSIDDIIEWHKKQGLKHVVITDHFYLFGVIDFYKKAKAAGLNPVIGCEMGYTTRYMGSKELGAAERDYYHHITLIAKNNIGYKNLLKLNSLAATKGMHYQPMCDLDSLREYSKGIICLSGCYNGVISTYIRNDEYEKAKETAITWHSIFGDDFYLEVMKHPVNQYSEEPEYRKSQEEFVEGEAKILAGIEKISQELDIPMVATNDTHYTTKNQSDVHDILFSAGQTKKLSDTSRYRLSCPEFYLKTEEEMLKLFPPDVVHRSVEIVEKCSVTIDALDVKKPLLPKYPNLPEGVTEKTYLREMVYKGLEERGKADSQEYVDRIEHELDVINELGWAGYFIILAKILEYCKERKILIGPSRGSAGASAVCWCCYITHVDPIKNDLLFARFLDKSRQDDLDVDVDIPSDYRDEVIDFVVKQYGEEYISQIGTIGTLTGKSAFKKVASTMEIDFKIANEVSSYIDEDTQLSKFINDPRIKKIIKKEPAVEEALKVAQELEGGKALVGAHAGGVVISPIPITDICPIRKYKGRVVTQWDMDTLHELRLIKYDFLGLKSLTQIENTIKEVKRNRGVEIDLWSIPEDDKKAFDMLSRGDSLGVFQLESNLCREYLKKMQPKRFEDIMAFTSLIRPGPLSQPAPNGGEGTMVDEFIRRMNGESAIEYPHPRAKDALKNTLGVVVFQESVMKITVDVAGFTDMESNTFRSIISKKKTDLMAEQKEKFISGCLENNLSKSDAEKMFDLLETFSQYGLTSNTGCN